MDLRGLNTHALTYARDARAQHEHNAKGTAFQSTNDQTRVHHGLYISKEMPPTLFQHIFDN
jgi:hypothetical protein